MDDALAVQTLFIDADVIDICDDNIRGDRLAFGGAYLGSNAGWPCEVTRESNMCWTTSQGCSCVDLSYDDLSGLDMSSVDFSYSILVNTSFERSNLTGADFTRAYIYGADFAGADLTSARLEVAGCQMFGRDRDLPGRIPNWDGSVCPDGTIGSAERPCLDCSTH